MIKVWKVAKYSDEKKLDSFKTYIALETAVAMHLSKYLIIEDVYGKKHKIATLAQLKKIKNILPTDENKKVGRCGSVKDDKKIVASYDEYEIANREIKYTLEELKNKFENMKNGKYFDFEDMLYSDLIIKAVKKAFPQYEDNSSLNEIFENMSESEFNNFLKTIEDKIKDAIHSDSFIYEIATEDFWNNLEGWYSNIENEFEDLCFYIEGSNMGWRQKSGNAVIYAKNMQDLFSKILPNTDTTVYVYDNGYGSLNVTVYHHDAPTGEYYMLTLFKLYVKEWLKNIEPKELGQFIQENGAYLPIDIEINEYDEDDEEYEEFGEFEYILNKVSYSEDNLDKLKENLLKDNNAIRDLMNWFAESAPEIILGN